MTSSEPAQEQAKTQEHSTEDKEKKSWLEWVTTTINGMAALIAAIAGLIAAVVAVPRIWPFPPPDNKSSICQFSDGWIDYAPLPGFAPGTGCQDGAGNNGLIVAKGAGARIPVSAICQFSNGWHDYTPTAPLRIGSACQDGRGNQGKVVANGAGSPI